MNTNTSPRRLLFILSMIAALSSPALAQKSRTVYEVKSKYQAISVWDSPDGNRRQMIFDAKWDGTDAIQSEVNRRNPLELVLSYAQYMIASVPVVENPKRILVVGLGGACIQRYLYNLLPDAVIETAELDPKVLDVAKDYFYLMPNPRQKVYIIDGRKFIEQSKDKYDLIMLDAFSATSIPYLLATQEFLKTVKDHLTEGGIVCANVWFQQESYHDMIKTYDSVFPEWHVLRCPGGGNMIVLALPTQQSLTAEKWIEKAKAFDKAHPTGMKLAQFIDRGFAPVTRIPTDAKVLLDKDAPKDR